MSNPAPTLNQINAFNATQGTTIDFNIIGGTEVIRSNKIYIYDLSDNSLICTHLYVSTESIHELPPNTSSSIVYASGKSSADFTNNTQYYAQIQTFTDVGGTQGGSGLSVAKLFWCLPTPTLTLSTIPTTISTTSYNVSATYTPNTSGGATNEIQEFQFNLYSAIGALLQTSGVVLYGEGVDLSYNFSGLEVNSTYYVTLDVTTTQGMNVSAQSNTFTVSIDTPTMGSASVVNNGCDGYISVTSNLSSEYEHEESSEVGEIISFTTDSVNDITELDVDFSPVQDGTPWMSTQNTEPYTFRAVPTQTEDFGHESDTIVGGTVAWNQWFPLGSDSWQVLNGSVDFTATNGRIVATGTPTGTNTTSLFPSRIYNQIKPIYGHKYLLYVYGTTNFNMSFSIYGSPTKTTQIGVLNGDGSKIIACETSSSTDAELVGNFTNGSPATADFHSYFIDLTQMFGSTIADYIYSLEQGTAGAGVAWFKKYFPKPYYAYNAGELMSVNAVSHNMVGFNAWDEEWELGYYGNDGEPVGSTTIIRGKNYIQVTPSTTYYLRTNAQTMYVCQYDADKNFIQRNSFADEVITLSANTHYIRMNMTSAYGTTYKNDICINLSDPSLNGTYKPYTKHTYPLDSTLTLRGIPKLDTSNNLYYDGDTYESDGTVTRKYGIVDLSTLDWSDSTSTRYISKTVTGMKPVATSTVMPNIIAQKYRTIAWNDGLATNHDGIAVSNDNNARLYLYKDENTSSPSGYLVYELATPTTQPADPFTNPQICDPYGTEEYVGSPIPVGHKTTYQRICPISGWDSVSVDVVGKNLFSDNVLDYIRPQDYFVCPIKLEQGAKYTASVKLKSGKTALTGFTIGLVKHGDRYTEFGGIEIFANATNWAPPQTRTFTITSAFDDPRIVVYTAPLNQQGFEEFFDHYEVQFEKGSTPTPYTPYRGTTYTSTFPKYKQQVSQDKIPYITKDIGDTYADTLTENLVGGTIAWNQSVPDTTTTHIVSGSIASMDDAVAGNFESVVCDIDPVQDLHGYDSPWVGGGGKNLYDVSSYPLTNGLSIVGLTGDLVVSTLQLCATESFIPCESWRGKTLTLNHRPNGQNTGFSFYSSNTLESFISGERNDNNPSGSWTFTVPNNASYFRFCCPIENKDEIQIEVGSTATAWTPYSNICPISGWTGCEVVVSPTQDAQDGTTYPISWQTEAGTVYGGTVDLVTGELVVDKAMIVLDGTESGWSAYGTDSTFWIFVDGKKAGWQTSKCNEFNNVNYAWALSDYGVYCDYTSDNRCYFRQPNASIVTLADFKTWLSQNPIQLCYELATPQTYQLTPVQVACLLGQNNVWNNISNTTVAYPTNHSYQSLSTTHKYYKRINGVESISVGSDVVATVGTDNIIDLTQMFGTTIADYIYNREQSSSSGMGVKFFKSLFPNDDYDYNSGELISVNASAHVIKDANGNVVHTYPLDSDLVLRGIPKLDANNKLYYDGDVYSSDGGVDRKFGIIDLGGQDISWSYESTYNRMSSNVINLAKTIDANSVSIVCAKYLAVTSNYGWQHRDSETTIAMDTTKYLRVYNSGYTDPTAFKTAMSGVYLVYELATQTTESADPFEENQTIVSNGIEEYTVTEQGDVEMPVGHDSTYYTTAIYGGTIDMASGVLTIDNKVVDLGSLTWTKVSNNNYANFYTSDLASDIVYNATTPTVMCSQYKPEANNTALASDDGYIWVNAQKTVRIKDTSKANMTIDQFKAAMDGVQLVYELATPIEISLTPQQIQTLSGQNNIWSNTNGGMSLIYQLPITSILVKRRDVADVSGKWLTLYSVPITQASDMDFTFIDFLNQYGKTYQYALVPVLAQNQSGVIVQIEGGYTVSDNVDSIFDGVYIADQTNVERVKAGVGYDNIDMNQGVGSITPIGSKYPIVITNSQNQYHNGSIRGTIVPNDFYSNGNLSRIDMVNKRDELEQFLTNKRAKIIKDWNGKMWLVMIMSNVACSFDDNYGMGIVSFSADWLEVGDPTNQQDLYNAGLINVGGV